MKKGLLIILILSSLMLEPVHSYGPNVIDNCDFGMKRGNP
jgi:hypothetical protein